MNLTRMCAHLNAVRRLAGIAAFSLVAISSKAELIPANRLIDWTPGVSVGVPGGIPTNRTQILDVTKAPYNADNTGVTNAAPAIQKAIDDAPGGTGVVYLPAGTYRCDTTLVISYGKDGITLRGSGPNTIIDTRSGNGISVGCASDYMWNWPSSNNTVTAGLRKGSTTVTIGDTSAFQVGTLIQFSIQNDPSIPVLAAGGGDFFRKQMCFLTGKTSSTLTFSPALYDDYGAGSLTVRVHMAQLETDYVGIEDLTLDCTNASTIWGIMFEQCYGCWMKNVRVKRAANYAFFIYDSSRCEMRGCYGDQRKQQGTNGAGLLCNASSACLVEDNIFYQFFPLMEINQGSSGNVFAYNFCYDSDVLGAMGAGINSNHGPHNSYNLYEGNASPNLQCDGYFGSASRDTVFRNWLHGTSPLISTGGWTISLNRFTREYSLVGNVIGTTSNPVSGYSFGNPNLGNGNSSGTAQPSLGRWWADWGKFPGPGGFQEKDLDVEATVLLKGNYLSGSGVAAAEALGSDTLPVSLYRTSKPAWFGTMAWPPFTPSGATPSLDSIPAGYRYLNPGSDTPGVPSSGNIGAQAPSNVKIKMTTT